MDPLRQNCEAYGISMFNGLINYNKNNYNNGNNQNQSAPFNRGIKRPCEDENEQEAQNCFKRLRIDNNYYNHEIVNSAPQQTNQFSAANTFHRDNEDPTFSDKSLHIQRDEHNLHVPHQRNIKINCKNGSYSNVTNKYTQSKLCHFPDERKEKSVLNNNTQEYHNMNNLLGKLHEERIRRSQEMQESFQNRQINSHTDGSNNNNDRNGNVNSQSQQPIRNNRQQMQPQRHVHKLPNQQPRPIIYLPSHSRLF
jgi:hypothetical protein